MSLEQILNTDLSDVSIKRPVLKPTITQFRILSCQVVDSRTPGKQNLEIQVETTQPVEGLNEKGETVTVNPGFRHTELISLTPTEKYPVERVQQELKKFMVSTGQEGMFGQPEQYIGKLAAARVTIESDASGEYDDRNRLKWVPADRIAKQSAGEL